MSNEAITWAYGQDVAAGAKFVLVALADLADEAHSCFPGQAKLAAMTGQGQRTVRRQLLELEIAGFLTRERRFDTAGHRTSDRYVLPVGQQIPTGQFGHRPIRPVAKSTSGQNDLRPNLHSLPANDDSPTGQNGQVSLREPSGEPPDSSSSAKADDPKSTKIEKTRDDVERICAHLADRLESNGCKRPTIKKAWRDAARLLMDSDGRTEQQIHNAIDWCQDDEFWRPNVMSLPKLRKQYDQLRLAAQRTRHKPRTGTDKASKWVQLGQELAATEQKAIGE